MEIVTLLSLGRSEVLGEPRTFLGDALAGKTAKPMATIVGDEPVHAVLLGGHPEMLRRKDQKRPRAWARDACRETRGSKKDGKKTRMLQPLTDNAIRDLLTGKLTARIYPLMAEEICWFLVADFDKKSWMADAAAFAVAYRRFQVPFAVERSRSGNGARIWFFFDRAVLAANARQLGCARLTRTTENGHELGLDSYDRLFPSQDTVAKGEFRNLIALPLQKRPRELGNGVSLDETVIRLGATVTDRTLFEVCRRPGLLPVYFVTYALDLFSFLVIACCRFFSAPARHHCVLPEGLMLTRVLFASLFLLFFSSPLWADTAGLTPSVGTVSATCFTTVNSATLTVGSGVSCDYSAAAFQNSTYYDVTVVGTASVSMANVTCTSLPCETPAVDVQGAVSSGANPYLIGDYLFEGISALKYSVDINQISATPEPITTVPILVNFSGETQGVGSTVEGYIHDKSGGRMDLPMNTPWVGNFTVGAEYIVIEEATCYAGNANTAVSSPECQAEGDPLFEFDQAAFNAEMGANTFPLSEYFSFQYSPNLTTPTPEPSSLSLLLGGLFVIGILALRGRFV